MRTQTLNTSPHNFYPGTLKNQEWHSNIVSLDSYYQINTINSSPSGEAIQLCSSKGNCLYARNFSAQFLPWVASEKFVATGLNYGAKHSGTNLKMNMSLPQ